MEKKLSIVVPTLNRCEYLKRTLECVLPQVERNLDYVDLVVCSNASEDDTDVYMKSLIDRYEYVRYKYFNEYVEVGQSLIRSVGEATGEYVVLLGDDDILFPYFTETILDIIKRNPGIGLIHCNRLQGKDLNYGFTNLFVTEKNTDGSEKHIYNIEEFVQKFTISLGFISSLIFQRKDFLTATNFYNSEHYGYEHLSIIVNGAKNKKCYYYDLPLEIQRVPLNRDFSDRWALYHFVGVPNMMRDFDFTGVCTDSLGAWRKSKESYGNASFIHYVWFMLYATLDKKFYKPRIQELNKYQSSIIRKILTYLIIYCVPKKLFTMIRNKRFK